MGCSEETISVSPNGVLVQKDSACSGPLEGAGETFLQQVLQCSKIWNEFKHLFLILILLPDLSMLLIKGTCTIDLLEPE